jgi:formylglycine-generating enzyme required for sulfatase activity
VENVDLPLCQSFLIKLNEKVKDYEFRLPTEAEWEYACRAGTVSEYNFVNDGTVLGDYAWFGQNSGGHTHAVGMKKPNAWGLYDMYGNVWEWCQDAYAPYSADTGFDPVCASSLSSGTRIMRGGAWNSLSQYVSSTYRQDVSPDVMMAYHGFRCVASVPPIKKRKTP